MISIAIQVLVVIMMLGVGLDLSIEGITRSPKMGRWLLLGVAINVILFPFWTWILIQGLDQTEAFTAGLVLCCAAPGGPVGIVLARLADSDLPYATALMVLLGAVGLFTTPITASLMLDRQESGLFAPMFLSLLLFQIVPLAVGMGIRRVGSKLAAKLTKPARLVSNLLLVVVVAALLATRWETIVEVPLGDHLLLVAGLAVVLAGVLYWSPGESRLRGLLIVTSARNISIALLLANRLLDDPGVEAAVLVWAFWMIVLPVVFSLFAVRLHPNEAVETPVDQVAVAAQ